MCHLRQGKIDSYELDPTDLDLPFSHPNALRADGPEDSARIIRSVLAGEKGPARDIVCLNAAAALVVAEVAGDLATGLDLAGEAIDSGAAGKTLADLAARTSADASPVG